MRTSLRGLFSGTSRRYEASQPSAYHDADQQTGEHSRCAEQRRNRQHDDQHYERDDETDDESGDGGPLHVTCVAHVVPSRLTPWCCRYFRTLSW